MMRIQTCDTASRSQRCTLPGLEGDRAHLADGRGDGALRVLGLGSCERDDFRADCVRGSTASVHGSRCTSSERERRRTVREGCLCERASARTRCVSGTAGRRGRRERYARVRTVQKPRNSPSEPGMPRRWTKGPGSRLSKRLEVSSTGSAACDRLYRRLLHTDRGEDPRRGRGERNREVRRTSTGRR